MSTEPVKEPVAATSSPAAITTEPVTADPSTAQYDAEFGTVLESFKKLMGSDPKPTVFDSAKAVLEVLDELVGKFPEVSSGKNDDLKTWLESYVELLFTVSAKVWENTKDRPSPEQTISNAIVVLIKTAHDINESYKSLVEFFDDLQYYLQRVCNFYDLMEFSFNTAEIKGLLLKVMAGALSSLVDYIRVMREKPTRRVLRALARRRDSKNLVPYHMDKLTKDDALILASKDAVTPTTEKPNLDAIPEGDNKTDVVLAPPVAKEDSKGPAASDGGDKPESNNESKVSPLDFDELKRWLNPPAGRPDEPERPPGAGKWFTQGKAFQLWKKKDEGSSLLICGEPGSGKTILCTSILDNLAAGHNQNNPEIIAGYYFGSENWKPDRRNFRGLLTSLVTQLCKELERPPESIRALYEKSRNGSNPPSEAELTQFLIRFLPELQDQFSIYIVIDGIDNCTEAEATDSPRRKVLNFLEGLVRLRDSKLNICITSSLKEDMEKSLKPLAASCRKLNLHNENEHKQEVKTYIATFVRNHMQRLSEDEKKKVINGLSKRAGGLFGWISLRLEAVRPQLGDPLLRADDILEKVGTPREEEFAQALQAIPEEKYKYAVGLFQCMVAATRSFSHKELADISAELDPNAAPHEDAVLSVCTALVDRDKDDLKIVTFSDESIKGFLKSSRLRYSSIEKRSRYYFTQKDAEATLARVCIKVLLRFDKNAVKEDLTKSSPLPLYAAQYWVQHTEQAQQDNAATENLDVMKQLFHPKESHLEAWIWMHDVDKGQSRTVFDEHPPQRRGTPLYYAALCGFADLVKHLVDLCPEDLYDACGLYGFPLHAALYKGNEDAVKELLASDTSTKVKAVDRKIGHKTPLHAAYYGKQPDMMKLLLKRGANVEAKGEKGNTLLHCASVDGRVEVVELLLEYDPNINEGNDNGWTPLHRAALRGRVDVAVRLINFKPKDEKNKPLDLNAQSKNKNTPLHVASIAGKLQMVNLLLHYKAKTDIQGEHGWTPYDAAEKNRHGKVAEQLSNRKWRANEIRREIRRRLRRNKYKI